MGDRIEAAKAALLVFLKSLPPGCYFNIVGFGSSFALLFPEYEQLCSLRSSVVQSCCSLMSFWCILGLVGRRRRRRRSGLTVSLESLETFLVTKLKRIQLKLENGHLNSGVCLTIRAYVVTISCLLGQRKSWILGGLTEVSMRLSGWLDCIISWHRNIAAIASNLQ